MVTEGHIFGLYSFHCMHYSKTWLFLLLVFSLTNIVSLWTSIALAQSDKDLTSLSRVEELRQQRLEKRKASEEENTKEEKNNDNIKNEKVSMYNIPHIDETRIQQSRLQWLNTERIAAGKTPLSYEPHLSQTSTVRAQNLASTNKFHNMHQRIWCPVSRCTDLINTWFKENGILWNAGESVGRWSYRCNSTDCTDTFTSATKKRFIWLFVKEASYNGVHYKMMMSDVYTKVWFWFALAQHPKRWQQYILVAHFSD